MFDWIMDLGTYEGRKIARYEEGDLFVDTCAISDSAQPYETAVAHPAYNDGEIVIVEMYDTVGDAETGHARWLATMTADNLPAELVDVSTAGIADFCDAIAPDDSRRRFSRKDDNG